MKFQVVKLVFGGLALTVTIAACSGGGQQSIGGRQCEADARPGFQDVPAANQKKIQTNADGTIDLPPGEYKYTHAYFYYEDDANKPRNYRILVQEVLAADGVTWKVVPGCIRNARAGMGDLGLAVSAKGLSALTVGVDNKPAGLNAKVYSFAVQSDGKTLTAAVPVADNEKPTLPESTFDAGANAYIFVHPENVNLIEVRSTGQSAHGTWHLSTTFLRADLPKTP